MHFENTITIERPIEEVFEYVSTPENDPTWVSASLRNQRSSPGPMRVGTTTEEDVKFLGRMSRYTWEITEYEPPISIAYRATSGLLPGAAVRLRLEPVEGGTRLTHSVDLEPGGVYFKAMAPFMPWMAQRLLDSMDRTLKDLMEGKPTTQLRRAESASKAGLARALGWVSIGVGLAIVAAPGTLMKAFGLGDRPNLGRLLGVRDLVIGAGLLLGGQNTAAWCRARGIADALDVALIVGGTATGAFRRDRAPIGVATGAGFSALSFWLARRLEGLDKPVQESRRADSNR
jgi:uncharacterized protein YndB with AHSA1/START domain